MCFITVHPISFLGGSVRSEAAYQARLIQKLKIIFPGCFVLKLDPSEDQGIPDILILFESHWFALEVKASVNSSIQPNQAYYVNIFNEMSFASFISPETENEVLDELRRALG